MIGIMTSALAAVNIKITEMEVSPYNREFLKRNSEKFKSSQKLCPDLYDKDLKRGMCVP